MATLDTTYFGYALKRRYNSKTMKNMSYKTRPFLALLRKEEDFTGANYCFGVQYADVPTGAVYATVKAVRGYQRGVQFVLTRKKDYAPAAIDSETLLASQGSEGAMAKGITSVIDSAISALSNRLEQCLFLNGTGTLGTVSSASTYYLTLTDANDAKNFYVGQTLCHAVNVSTNPVSNETTTVSGVNRNTGVITCSAMVATTWTTPTDDLLFISGDYTAASDTLKVSGLAHWIPYTAPSASESYYGVDRSVDPDRLAGVRVDATTLPIDEAVYKLASQVADNGGVPDLCFMNYDNHEKLQNIMGAKAVYMDFKVGEVNFAAARINGPAGPIRVIPDRFCSGNRIYCLTQETWALKSLGSVPMILDLDGNKFLRDDAYDSYEVRVAYMGNLYTDAPGYNGVAAVS